MSVEPEDPTPEAVVDPEVTPEDVVDPDPDHEDDVVIGEQVLVDPITQAIHIIPEEVANVPPDMYFEDDDDGDVIVAKLRRQGIKLGPGMIAPRVFFPAVAVILAVVVFAFFWPDAAAEVFESVQGWIVANLGWYYVLIVPCFVLFALYIALSRLGRIRLGRDDEKPEFTTMSWFAMLFAAGMGIGLVFYGVGEPLMYATVSQKPGWSGDDIEIAGLAMAQSFVHWGFHPWGIYAVIGLAIAYAIHRRGRPVSIRWSLEPILGSRVKGWAGDVIDILAIFGTVFGVATSLGLGVQQISAGLVEVGVVDVVDNTLLVGLILGITLVATISVVSGIGAGMKWLSNINLSLAGVLLIAVLILGPTVFLLDNLVQSLGVYLGNVMQMTFDVGAFQSEEGHAWFAGWTIFYWGWWVSWAPFVGIFIARISRGRTVREFIIGVLVAPTLVGFVWFAVMGGTGLFRQLLGEGDLVQDGEVNVASVLFQVLDGLPWGTFWSVLGIILVAIFFITSSDSGSLVVDMLASGGHPNPPTWSRVMWSSIEGAVAIALLIAGGLVSLQAAAIATALPFSVILILMCFATYKGLRAESVKLDWVETNERVQQQMDLVVSELADRVDVENFVDDRIDYRINYYFTAARKRRQKRESEGPDAAKRP